MAKQKQHTPSSPPLNLIMYILSTKFIFRKAVSGQNPGSAGSPRYLWYLWPALILLSFFALQACASNMKPRIRPFKDRLQVAIIFPTEYATLAMDLYRNYKILRKNIRRTQGLPRIKLRTISWQDFSYDHTYVAYDAVIYISLYSQIPSDLSNSLSNKLGRSLPELLKSPIFSGYSEPRRFVWFLFRDTNSLDRYRLLYPDLPYLSSNTGEAALRKIFEVDLFRFLLRLKEIYS
ncbi:hypothetical protein P0082_04245 [Candidatus Haliotispira prima]|uniref:Lipoprotein n=1 Tax=Candidatus Haliotispira prima TaxID=3034016 RepID=A0ABY8MJ80_9SPIO|nr:hypothetical protein P0082_04245 [Candidatus Haliotispira prima]